MTIVFAVSAAVFDAAGRILLVERARPPNAGKWSLPGGRAEPGERRTEAVVREVREETGIAVEVGELVAETQVRHGDVEYSITTYLARPIGGVLAAASDARAAGFVTADELARLPLTDGLLPVIEKARAMQLQWW